MAFVKEQSEKFLGRFELKEWEYLTGIGVRDMWGMTISKKVLYLVVDRERNYYLIPRGLREPSDYNYSIYYYALCLDGTVINMEVNREEAGNNRNCTLEYHWDIKKIEFPSDWENKNITDEELINIIKEAIIVNSYNKVRTADMFKEITVTVSALVL